MIDTILGIAGIFLGIAGLGVSIFAIIDNRRQRTQREQAVIAARAIIERMYGLLVGIKPAVAPDRPDVEAAINDGLSAINQERKTLEGL